MHRLRNLELKSREAQCLLMVKIKVRYYPREVVKCDMPTDLDLIRQEKDPSR